MTSSFPTGPHSVDSAAQNFSASTPEDPAEGNNTTAATATGLPRRRKRAHHRAARRGFHAVPLRNLCIRVLVAAFGGAAVYASFAPVGLWPLGIVGITLLLLALAPGTAGGAPTGAVAEEAVSVQPHVPVQPTAAQGAAIGFAHGVALYGLLLPWIGEFVGAMPYVALAITEAVYSAAFGALGVVLLRQRWGLVAAPWVFVFVEWVRATWPFGGFGWGRIAWGQVGGPVAWAARVGGPTLVSACVVCVAVVAVCLLTRAFSRQSFTPSRLTAQRQTDAGGAIGSAGSAARHVGDWGPRAAGWRTAAIATAVVVASVGLGLLPTGPSTAEIRVAAIQGNVPRMGLDFNAQRRQVLANHVAETHSIDPAPGQGPEVDLVVWPENASDVNPFRDAEAGKMVRGAARDAQAPIVVGTITSDAIGARNTMVVIGPDGSTGDVHYKKFLQPFGEYMPLRDFFRLFSPLVDQAGDFKPGTGDGVVRVRAARSGAEVAVGISTCYEVAFDASARSAISAGAEILATPTNNATFGFTDMTYQQLAMSRMRAIEYDRAVVVAATSGVSALISPTGEVLVHSEIFTPDTLVDTLPLRSNLTIAAHAGSVIAAGLDNMGFLCALAALAMNGRSNARVRKSVMPHTPA